MRHRVFVAINPDKKAVAKMAGLIDECRKKLPPGINRQIRFLPPENWHITLSFLGYQEETDIEKIKAVLGKFSMFGAPYGRRTSDFQGRAASSEIRIEKLIWGPPGSSPRMIWLLGGEESSKKLGEIKTIFEDLLEEAGVPFRRETRKFSAHITLARFDFGLPRPRPVIEKNVDLRFMADSLDLMESRLERGGAKYAILQAFPLEKDF